MVSQNSTKLNRGDTVDTAVVYYALFVAFTILVSAVMMKDWCGQFISLLCEFLIALSVCLSLQDPSGQTEVKVHTRAEEETTDSLFTDSLSLSPSTSPSTSQSPSTSPSLTPSTSPSLSLSLSPSTSLLTSPSPSDSPSSFTPLWNISPQWYKTPPKSKIPSDGLQCSAVPSLDYYQSLTPLWHISTPLPLLLMNFSTPNSYWLSELPTPSMKKVTFSKSRICYTDTSNKSDCVPKGVSTKGQLVEKLVPNLLSSVVVEGKRKSDLVPKLVCREKQLVCAAVDGKKKSQNNLSSKLHTKATETKPRMLKSRKTPRCALFLSLMEEPLYTKSQHLRKSKILKPQIPSVTRKPIPKIRTTSRLLQSLECSKVPDALVEKSLVNPRTIRKIQPNSRLLQGLLCSKMRVVPKDIVKTKSVHLNEQSFVRSIRKIQPMSRLLQGLKNSRVAASLSSQKSHTKVVSKELSKTTSGNVATKVEKSIPRLVKSNRKIQPASRLLQVLKSSKIPCASVSPSTKTKVAPQWKF